VTTLLEYLNPIDWFSPCNSTVVSGLPNRYDKTLTQRIINNLVHDLATHKANQISRNSSKMHNGFCECAKRQKSNKPLNEKYMKKPSNFETL